MAIKKKNIAGSKSAKAGGKNYLSGKSKPRIASGKKASVRGSSSRSVLEEHDALYTISSRLRPIGNSKGVIIPNRVIEEAGISPEAELVIQASDGVILISEAKSLPGVNTDLSTWEEQFRKAIKEGKEPENDLWGNIQNRFDKEEWS